MAGAEWSIPLGILVFIVALLFAVYYYMKYKKVFLIVFVASIATYVFAAFYTWDVFELNKNWIMGMLSISTLLMFGLAKYFSNLVLNPVKPHTSLKEKNNY
ncbi:MAG: hypothetical protein KC589_10695 [Nanoarchaeota archaeon]|nr:hypothetical protein [Nanoarchaeota archaeon]